LRTTLEQRVPEWRASPIFREEKIAYTDANPIRYWDDDLFGYMRAPGKADTARKSREQISSLEDATPVKDTVTRASPFRVSTLVSIAPVNPTSDFGVMSRHEGNPVPHEHQFYRTTLKGSSRSICGPAAPSRTVIAPGSAISTTSGCVWSPMFRGLSISKTSNPTGCRKISGSRG
jgi:hypothetical protein